MSETDETTACARRAQRMKDAWHCHRDKLADMTMPSSYSRNTRESLARAVRALIFAMDRAKEGGNVEP